MDIRDGLVGSIGHTPHIELRSLSDKSGCTILGKAEARGRLAPGAIIVEGRAGNTGIGLTAVANARGYRAVIAVPRRSICRTR